MQHLLLQLRDLLVARGATLSTAESCTGGRMAALMTEVSGSSRFYQGGIVAYQNAVKVQELSVPEAMIERHGVVSEPVARAMVEGACRKFGTTYALASTGYAEPWDNHPVEIWLAWGSPDDIHTLCLTDDNGRLQNVQNAAREAVVAFCAQLKIRS